MRACEHIRVYRCNRIDSFQGNVELLPRNLNIILITFVISALCYVSVAQHQECDSDRRSHQMIDEFYVDPVDHDALIDAAMTGLTSKLDEHSEYIPPQMYGAFKDVIEQEFAGVGIWSSSQSQESRFEYARHSSPRQRLTRESSGVI